ncbi:hypothetical protein D918_04428 [Trichuris suis]|nr:hypothetical protein D918_04428 [Trichuris suis]
METSLDADDPRMVHLDRFTARKPSIQFELTTMQANVSRKASQQNHPGLSLPKIVVDQVAAKEPETVSVGAADAPLIDVQTLEHLNDYGPNRFATEGTPHKKRSP